MACVASVAEMGTLSPEIDTGKGVTACRNKTGYFARGLSTDGADYNCVYVVRGRDAQSGAAVRELQSRQGR